MLGVGLEAPQGLPGLASPSSSEVPVVHSETGFDWQGGDGQSATSLALAHPWPDSQSRETGRMEGQTLCPPRGQGSCFSRGAKGSA